MHYRAIIFDLDGTLLDTIDDIAGSMNSVLKKLGFSTHRTEDYKLFVGEGMEKLCTRVIPEAHQSPEIINKCVSLMKSEYQKNWLRNTKPYPGIPILLQELEKQNVKMAVLSNKPDPFTKLLVQTLLPETRFSYIIGECVEFPKKPAPDSALHIASMIGITPAEFVYLGDSGIDMKTATNAGMYPVGALWGFRTAQELIATGARSLINSPEELLSLFS